MQGVVSWMIGIIRDFELTFYADLRNRYSSTTRKMKWNQSYTYDKVLRMTKIKYLMKIEFYLITYLLNLLQWLPLESLQVLFYEAKVPFSERFIAIWKCHHAIELLKHSYHALALSKEVYNFVFAQGAQKLSAIKI